MESINSFKNSALRKGSEHKTMFGFLFENSSFTYIKSSSKICSGFLSNNLLASNRYNNEFDFKRYFGRFS